VYSTNGGTVSSTDFLFIRYIYLDSGRKINYPKYCTPKSVPLRQSRIPEDTITLNGVAEHNPEYTLPDIAAAMQVGNWFDDIADNDDSEEIEIIEGYYSIKDSLNDLMVNEECLKIMKGWLMQQGNPIFNKNSCLFLRIKRKCV